MSCEFLHPITSLIDHTANLSSVYLTYFVLSLQSQIYFGLTPYVYSAFSAHKLTSISSTMAFIIGGVLRLPIGKMIDIWGRAEGLAVMLTVTVVGLIIMSCATNVAAYAAAYVIYYVGYDGIFYILQVFIADTSKLRNRGLMLAFSQTPFIATTFAGPAAAQSLYTGPGWRWGFGMFCIIYPVIVLPLVGLFLWNQSKARKQGLLITPSHGRSTVQSIKYYLIEFDIGGMVILLAGLVLFLLPFNIAATETNGWGSHDIIAMIVVGIVLLIFFPFYEKFITPKPFIPWGLLINRTVGGAALTIFSLYISFYCWDLYFSSFLQVVYRLSLTDAGYVANIYNIGSCFWGVIVGLLLRYTNRYKWIAIIFVPIYILGSGLMIYFRRPDSHVGYIIMCQIFIAFSGGTLVTCHEVAALAASSHGSAAMVLAIVALASQIGGAVGDTIAAAIWQNTFPKYLAQALPASEQGQAATIYASLTTQLGYAWGTPERDAINAAYGAAMRDMCIASTSVCILTLIAVWMWRDIRLDNKKQVKGVVV